MGFIAGRDFIYGSIYALTNSSISRGGPFADWLFPFETVLQCFGPDLNIGLPDETAVSAGHLMNL
jgi:hypothetical protein